MTTSTAVTRIAGLATLALAWPVLATAAPASAAPTPQCHGQRATVVGHGAKVTGTRHRDVIVSNGARTVIAGAGDDLVCLTGGRGAVTVDAGAGDDTVENRDQNPQADVSYRSGTGSDRYLGAGGFDNVAVTPDGHDHIATRGGGDFVTVTKTRHPGNPQIDLGSGDDIVDLELAGMGGRVVGGSGQDSIDFTHHSSHAWTVDNQRGRASADGETRFRWSSFDYFELDSLQAPRVTFLGSDAPETVFMPNARNREVEVSTGGGDDDVNASAGDHGRIDLGSGTDHLNLHSIGSTQTLAVDLTAGTAAVDGTPSYTLAGVERLSADSFARATLAGTQGPDTLTADGCGSSIDGRGGDDVLRVADGCAVTAAGTATPGGTIHGGDGNDTLAGGYLDDTLDGGPGLDSADGGPGTDTCDAESTTNCELP